MKQIASNYSYSPTTNVVTLAGVNIDQDQLLLIVAPGVGRTLYNFASVTGTVVAGADTRVALNASTAGLTTTSPLVIFYDDHVPATSVTGTVALDPASLIALENITVTVGSSVALAAGSAQVGSVTISNFPSTQTIAGTVTANTAYAVNVTGIAGFAAGTVTAIPVALVDRGVYGGNLLGYNGTNTYLNTAIESVGGNSLRAGGTFPVSGSVTIGSLPAISGTVTVGNVAGFNIPTHDYKSFGYTESNLTQIAYKTGGANGTTVGIVTLAYDGNGNLTSMTKS